MKETLITLLSTFGYPVFQQGSLAKDEPYPESFFTFWNNATDDGSHYDNDAISFVWNFSVYFYSTDPTLVDTMMKSVRTLLKTNEWILDGVGYDVPSDEITHTGRAIDALFLQRNI